MNSLYFALPVLVTGGAGFIGSHLVEKLVSAGAHVTVIDNLTTGSLSNLEKVIDQITFINGDITHYKTCLAVTKNKKIIFHLAAFISVPQSMENPELCYKTNVLGTLTLLHAAATNGVSRFVFSSSSAIYGTNNKICSEIDIPHPQSPYAHSKLLGEQLGNYFNQQYGLTTSILRYFNVYGPRQNPNGAYAAVVAKFKEAMKNNESITIFGDGLQTRDFVPVQTIVDANLLIACTQESETCEIYNIGTGKSITLMELIDHLKKTEFPEFSAALHFLPARPGDIKHSQADCSKYQLLQRNQFLTLSY